MHERRQYERKSSAVRVEIKHPAFGIIIGSATDISDGGARVTVDHTVIPPVGTEVQVQFKRMIDHINQEPVAMRVMHAAKNGIGLMFLPRT